VTWRDDNGIMSEATFWLFSQITSWNLGDWDFF
jgi:hypothetical protein